ACGASSATGSSVAGVSSAAGSSVAGVSSVVSSWFSFFSSSAMGLSRQTAFAHVADGQDSCDLALGQLQARGVLQRARDALEAQVEELLARLGQPVLQFFV